MKRLQIDFVSNDKWLKVWVPATVALVIVLGAIVVTDRSMRARLHETQQQTEELKSKIERASASRSQSAPSTSDAAKLQQLRTAAQQLQLDFNPAFSTIENIQEPGVRLALFSVDAPSRIVRVEYEVDSLALATAVTGQMNAGAPKPVWRLESVVASSPSQSVIGEKMRAAWTTNLDQLR